MLKVVLLSIFLGVIGTVEGVANAAVKTLRSGLEKGTASHFTFPNQAEHHAKLGDSGFSSDEAILPVSNFWDGYGYLFGVKPNEMQLIESIGGEAADDFETIHIHKQVIRGHEVYSGNVNVKSGQHGGVIAAIGHPLPSAMVDGISEVPGVKQSDALINSLFWAQRSFGPMSGVAVKAIEPVRLRSDIHQGKTGVASLTYKIDATLKLDEHTFNTCFAVEKGLSQLNLGGAEGTGFEQDISDITYRYCQDRVLDLTQMKNIHAEFAKQGMDVNNIVGEWTLPLPAANSRFYMDKNTVSRRVEIFVNVHTGAISMHHDLDLAKSISAPKGSRKAGLNSKVTSHLRKKAYDRATTYTFVAGNPGDAGAMPFNVIITDCQMTNTLDMYKDCAKGFQLYDSTADAFPWVCTGTDCDNPLYYPDKQTEVNRAIISTLQMANLMKSISNQNYLSFKKTATPLRVNLFMDIQNAHWISMPNGGVDMSHLNVGMGYNVDDVIAHEFGHGYNEYTYNFNYFFQSGALNEAIADIYAEVVDMMNTIDEDSNDGPLDTLTLLNYNRIDDGIAADSNGNFRAQCTWDPRTNAPWLWGSRCADSYPVGYGSYGGEMCHVGANGNSMQWLIGEGLSSSNPNKDVLRDMYAPYCMGFPGSCLPGVAGTDYPYVCTTDYYDNGGVHYNSLIMGRLFSLLTGLDLLLQS